MLYSTFGNSRISIALLCLLFTADISMGLRDVRVEIPAALKRGDNARLICNYDMEGDSLYSIKWYKGKREFYRYTPKETQSIKTFPVPGINVETAFSNATQVVIKQVDTNISGKFSCEVSADAPHFNTMIVSGEMQIVDIPSGKPLIDNISTRYRPGDEVKGNCTTLPSRPAANLSWTINDVPALPSQLIIYKLPSRNDSNLESTILGINFPITTQHFVRGKLKLKCLASIHEIYKQSEERFIEEIRPKILATGTSSMNMYHSVLDGESLTDPNVGMTQYKDTSSSSPAKPWMYSYLTFCWVTFYICTICTILFYSLRVGIS